MHVVFNFYQFKKKKQTNHGGPNKTCQWAGFNLGLQLGPDCHSKWLWSGQVFKATLATEPLFFCQSPLNPAVNALLCLFFNQPPSPILVGF